MAKISFDNVPLEAIEALANTASILRDEEGQVIQETDGQKAKRHIVEYVKDLTKNYEARKAHDEYLRTYQEKDVS